MAVDFSDTTHGLSGVLMSVSLSLFPQCSPQCLLTRGDPEESIALTLMPGSVLLLL